jgi:probable F420-dependent oxidoreductase
VRFGLALPHYGFSLPDGAPITPEPLLAWARRAEAMGFDSVWVSDHFFYTFRRYGANPAPIAALEPITALAAIAAVTERVRLGTLVLGSPFRHPALVAKMATTIDGISGGRLDLGVGAGWMREEFDAFGYAYGTVGERFAILEETLQVLAALRSGAPVDFDGPTVALHDARLLPAPVQSPIPVWVGGKGGPRLLRLAARYAAGWNAVWRWSPSAYAERADAARIVCEAEGRDPATFRLSVGLYGLIGEEEGATRAAFERGRAGFPGGAMATETYETWCADTLSGTATQILERVQAFEDAGVEEIVWSPWVLPFAIPEPEQVDLFADGVLGARR